jgi:hypothetical protein
MTGRRTIVPRFGARERERLVKLFRQLGTDNIHEAEAARSAVDGLLRQFGKAWADLIELLGGTPAAIQADLAHDITALGSSDPDERARAHRSIGDRLARHRKTWNDLADALCTASCEAWARDPSAADPPRVNPLALVLYLLSEYVALQPHQAIAVALWALHTHVYDRFMVTPRLVLRSPTADAGKTTLLDILSRLVSRPEKFDAITTAALYRVIDEKHPTLLIDEADNLGIALRPNGRLRALFNSGHRAAGTLAIVERGELRRFSTFAPLALALPEMRGLPRTLDSRAVSITMERSTRGLKRFDANRPDLALDAAYLQIFMWRREVKLDPDPEMPAALARNRFSDNWRPLISIADALDYGEQAREAMALFAREYADADAKILLLADIRRVFDACGLDRLASKALLDALHAMDDAGWCEFRGARDDQQPHKLRPGELAAMLRDFDIKPRTIWPRAAGGKRGASAKGYTRRMFEAAWARYCADDGTAAHGNNIRSLRRASDGTA